jgi:RsiW-degrading membrane proteinase PrsW (M82 family)
VTFLIKIAIGVVPVLFFLGVLVYMDSFRLVRISAVASAIMMGCSTSVVCLFLNWWLMDLAGLNAVLYSRYAAPPIEEAMKAVYILFLIRSKRADFLIDSAVYGFATGAGFAVVENIYYSQTVDIEYVFLWVVRGFGTAGIHGAATAIFGILAYRLSQREQSNGILVFLLPLATAASLHSLFNHFILSPVTATIWLILLLPVSVMFVYDRCERATRAWLGIGIDTEMELLEEIRSGRVSKTRVGHYLQTLRQRFRGEIVADMLCFLRIHLELSIGAKGILLMQSAGLRVGPDVEIRAKLDELKYLERSLGKTGRLAIRPFFRLTRRDLWQLYMLNRF